MDLGRPVVATLHVLLASTIAIVALIGMFGATGLPGDTADGAVGIGLLGRFGLGFILVLPLAGAVALGMADWQWGRGATILRSADLAAFALGMLDLSLGATGLGRWLAGAVALLAAAGLAASIVVSAPRRPGWRR